jgi:hypothetical protein
MVQLMLNPVVLVSKEVQGIEMGVLEDGTPFLTGRGLARVCGVAASAIIDQAKAWKEGKRDGKLARMLIAAGFGDRDLLYMVTKNTAGGGPQHAFPDDVCIVVLEYYAFEVGSEGAKTNFRILARKTLRDYIYTFTGYDPRLAIPAAWRYFHDRLLLNIVPVGYFSVFREMADIVLSAIRAGLEIDTQTVPDISVGKAWSTFWTDGNLEAEYGPRTTYEHNYPDYFPQSASNPQDAYAYPVEALGAFRRWMHEHYLPDKFPGYLKTKVAKGLTDKNTADLVLAAVGMDVKGLPPAR